MSSFSALPSILSLFYFHFYLFLIIIIIIINSYINIFISEHAIEFVIAKLAHCMSLFPNLHTVQIEASRQLLHSSMMERIFEGNFGGWSYPPICEIFIPSPCGVLVSSCPHVQHVGVTPCVSTSKWRWPFLLCCRPHLEYLGNLGDISGLPNIFSSTSSLLFLV